MIILTILLAITSSWSQSKSKYPILKVLENGDTIVVLTKSQADQINIIFSEQKDRIYKLENELDSSLLTRSSFQEKNSDLMLINLLKKYL